MNNQAINELMEYAERDISDLHQDDKIVRIQLCVQPETSGSPSFMFYQPVSDTPSEITILEWVPDYDEGMRVKQTFLLGEAYDELCKFINRPA